MKPAETSSPAASSVQESGGALTIDLGAVAANWRMLRERAGTARCAAVVKADAYGLGIEPVVGILAGAGCDTFFVALLSEAVRVRNSLPAATVYVLNGLGKGTAADLRKHRLEPVLGSLPEIDEWEAFCGLNEGPLPAAIHVDTGMTRHGLTIEEAGALAARLPGLKFRPSLLMSHFACADEPAHPMNAKQIAAFRSVKAMFPGVPASLSNSAGTLAHPDAHFDLVRPGVAIYGGRALLKGGNPMRPVVRLALRIVQVRTAKKGDSVGYGASHHLARDSRIAVCAAGYADGIFRAAGASDDRAGAEAIVAGKRCPLVGRISMDLLSIDVTDLPENTVRRGDFATLIGDGIDVDEFAGHAGTIGYEVLTSLGRRYSRDYCGG